MSQSQEPGAAPAPAGVAARLKAAAKGGWSAARRWKRPVCGAAPFAVASALVVVLLNNRKLFSLMSGQVDLLSVSGLACFATAFLSLTGMIALAFLVLGLPWVLKPLVIATLLLSAMLSYFTQELGAVFDLDMVRNIADAVHERNGPEAAELISWPLALHVALYGLLPALLALLPRLAYGGFRAELRSRGRWLAGIALLWALVSLPNFRFLAYFSREHHHLRYYATPTFALNSLRKYAMTAGKGAGAPFAEIGADAVQRKSGRRRTVGILVVGETARADHFSLNGYGRKTNPRLELRTLLNYPNVRASGTSTGFSVPCMFSFLGRDRFTRDRAARQSNLVDVLSRAGVQVLWIDNNSGPKGICDRLGYLDFRSGAPPAARRDEDGIPFDEELLGVLDRPIDAAPADLLIVLHVMGSHGPAYYRRYPPAFDVFRPACTQSSPQRSPQAEVVNAYDNTILYTDHVLDRLIALLEKRRETDATFLVYVSDHGESLGENGIYLHGLPALLAPAAQTQVPMLAWLSPGLLADRALDLDRLRERASRPCSHDHLAHTMLGLFQVGTSLYREDLDLLRR